VTAPVCRMITRYCGLPKPEYQILTSRPPLDSWLFESGARPTVRAAASLVSKISSAADPYRSMRSRQVSAGRTMSSNCEQERSCDVSRLMPGGLSIRV